MKTKEEIIKTLSEGICDDERFDNDPNEASFGFQTGVLLCRNDALLIRDWLTEQQQDQTKIKQVDDAPFGSLPVTECCGIGPITNENYCPNCGKRIIK